MIEPRCLQCKNRFFSASSAGLSQTASQAWGCEKMHPVRNRCAGGMNFQKIADPTNGGVPAWLPRPESDSGYIPQLSSAGACGPSFDTPVPNFGRPVPNFGRPVPNFGRPVPNFGRHVPNFGRHVPNFGRHVPNFGRLVPFFGTPGPFFGTPGPFFGPSGPFFGTHVYCVIPTVSGASGSAFTAGSLRKWKR